jgi:hypothetical protein
MRIFKAIGILIAALALSAAALATAASAAETLWKWLPGSAGETFTGEQPAKGELKIGGGSAITCAKAKILLTDETLKASSELLKEGSTEGKDATLELWVLHYEGCKFGALLPMNTLGDAKEILLIHLEVHHCMIKAGEFGLLILPLQVHIEVPSTGLLITIFEKGLYIAKLESEAGSKSKFLLTAKQAGGAQTPEKCEGGEKETLKAKVDAEAETNATIESTVKLTFDLTKDKNGEEMMEK